jgi:DNA-binding transcriptional regulator YdaS (Cro superfamily)
MNTSKQKGEEIMKNLKERIHNSPFGTQERFAAGCGITEAYISKYCRGIRRPSQKHLEIIKKTLLEPKKKDE